MAAQCNRSVACRQVEAAPPHVSGRRSEEGEHKPRYHTENASKAQRPLNGPFRKWAGHKFSSCMYMAEFPQSQRTQVPVPVRAWWPCNRQSKRPHSGLGVFLSLISHLHFPGAELGHRHRTPVTQVKDSPPPPRPHVLHAHLQTRPPPPPSICSI